MPPWGGSRQIPFLATDHETSHGGDITWTLRAKEAPDHIRKEWVCTSWIIVVVISGTRHGMPPFNARHLFFISMRTTPDAMLRLVRDRWSIEGWHWIRDTQLLEDAHRYRGNGSGVLGSLRTVALNLLRLERFQSIRAGMQRVSHDITVMLGMARRETQPT
jgi:hypothetical protein